jgi:predicted ATPase/DNA-binding CsgD family transcriptional regulator
MISANIPQAVPGNLPAPLSSFIGRTREIAEIQNLLSKNRLLTLTGSGGAGKTRLAYHSAGFLKADFKDGIWATEFAALTEGDLAAQSIASALGVQEQGRRPIFESLVRFLQPRSTLLILDNCEHLIDPIAQLSKSLLESCPNVKILATSREPLGVAGEMVFVVPPLSLPEAQPWRGPGMEQETLARYQQSEAIQLFITRAILAASEFKLTVQNGPWVAEICRRLDGIPLAIELAAARMRAFSVRQIAERLDDRFRLLISSERTAPLRHQTLAAALDWSYEMLPVKEQKMLQQLSIFASRWTLESAEFVCTNHAIKQTEVLELLSNLVDKSFVVPESMNIGRRYRLLETIRQYAYEKLDEAGNAAVIRDRHLEYFLQWAESNVNHLMRPEQHEWLRLFEVEYDNLRAALEWGQKNPAKARQGLRLAVACGRFWRLHGYFREGREQLTNLLNLDSNQNRTLTRAWGLIWAAHLAYMQSDYSATRSFAENGLRICRELDPEGMAGAARALDLLGELASEVGDYETANQMFVDALQIYRQLNDKRGTADMLMQQGWAAMRVGDYERAELLSTAYLPLFQELNESEMLGQALAGLGELSLRQGRIERANSYLNESLAIRRALGERWGVAVTLGSLGWSALLERDFVRMCDLLEESLMIRTEIGEQGGTAWCLEKLAEASFLIADTLSSVHKNQLLRLAAQIYGAAAAMRIPIHSVIDPADQPGYQAILANLRRALGDEDFETAWDKGMEMPVQEAIDFALSSARADHGNDWLLKSSPRIEKPGGLSQRELEVVVLIAQGKSNRQIAEAMTVRIKTVETYITRIMNKLGFDSRVQIATWAVKQDLTQGESKLS